MKKRIFSWLLVLALAVGMLPTGALGAAPVEIADQAGLAAIQADPAGSYVLTGDIELTGNWTPISTFSGTLDGGGYTIRALQVSGSLSEAGLFASLGAGATVQDLTLEGCAVSSDSYSACVGALAGKVAGSSVSITNVGLLGGTVSATGSSSYCGGLVGNMTYAPAFSGCFNTGTVNGAYRTGGIAGILVAGTSCTNCYATGPVTASGGYAGGLFGYGYIYSDVTLTNCYAAATVGGDLSSYNQYGFGYTGGTKSCWKLENCYWDSELCANGAYGVSGGLEGLPTADMKVLEDTLGVGFQSDSADLNGGYPILAWQYTPDPSSTWTVTLTVEPKEAALTWDGVEQALDPAGVYVFEDLPYAGEHSWSVAYDAGDFAAQSGTITVKKDMAQTIVLSPNLHTLTFDLAPADAALTVTDAQGETLEPTGENIYTVPKGTYEYTATAFGYADATGTVTVETADLAQTVALSPLPAADVTFVLGELPQGGEAVGSDPITVTTADSLHTVSGSGLAWTLPVGYAYTYTFKSPGYQTVTGTVDLTDAQGGEAQSVDIPLTVRTAWDGVTTEQPQGEGTAEAPYQITCGEELAWLANYVNQSSSNGSSAHAVLTKDIDLGDNPWTPIGKTAGYSTYAYSSIFDGQGHTVKGLMIDSADGNQGLFGYVKDGTVRDLTVEGRVAGGGSSNTSGVAAIAAVFDGSNGLLENCVNKASVSGAQNAAGIAGLIKGGGAKTIRGCVNYGDVTVSGSNAGGIVGNFYYKCAVEDCYNRGAVSAGFNAGGVAGLLNDSGAEVRRCYTATDVAIGKKSSGTVDAATVFCLGSDALATTVTDEELKALPAALGSAFLPDTAGSNGGYPILEFQIEKFPVTFTVTPENAQVEVSTASGAAMTGSGENGTWTFALPAGAYRYAATAFGYEDQAGSFTVADQAVALDVALTKLTSRTVTFQITVPAGGGTPTVELTWNGQVIEPTGENTYELPYGAYQYTVKAKGCGRKTSALTVGTATATAIPVTLELSTVWDGESYDEPAQVDGVYQIGSGAELAWLARHVNDGNGNKAAAVLTNDIDLGNNPWTPMGNSYSVKYKSIFDGQGHTVSGLNVQGGDYAGLFGQAEKATVQNLVVRGTVTGTGRTGGVVGYAYGDCVIRNCGNEATVTGSGSQTGGVVGYIGSYSDTGSSITGCYNAGTVTGQGGAYSYTGGILGYDYAGEAVTFTDCYNVGAVTGDGYAGGLRAYGSSMVGPMVNCYNAGTIAGADESKTGAIAPGSASAVTNCYYLDAGTDANAGSAAKTAVELQQADFLALLNGQGQVWKQDVTMNGGYPVLSWQKAPAQPPVGGDYVLTPSEFIWLSATDPDTGESAGEITPYLQWAPTPGAAGYTITLWNQCYRPSGEGYERVEEPSVTLQNIPGADVSTLPQDQGLTLKESWLYFDLTDTLAALGDGRYHATVTPTGEAVPDLAYVQEHIFGYDAPYNRLAPVTGLAWDGTRATWTPKAGFGAEDGYAVTLYRLDDQSTPVPVHVQSVPGNYSRVDCSGSFAVGGRYAFSVSALACNPDKEGLNYADSLDSRRSDDPAEAGDAGVYTVSQAQRPDGTRDESWVAISTPEAWVDLANVEDVNATPDDPESNLQAAAWGKKYYLTADLDFSTLSAEYAAKTKSIGNVTHRFLGTLDGNGHKLLGLTLSGGEQGLFEYIGSTGCVYGLTVEGANMLTGDNAGILANNNFGTIDRCCVVGSNITSDTGAVLGGMVSRNYGVIRESYVQGGVLLANSTLATGHGGFAGANERGGLIERCWTSMEVQSQSDYAGGFVGLGYGETGNPATIRDCFALGNVSARSYSGGFVGRSVYEDCRYENCYAAGTLTVTDTEGHGFIGGNKPDSGFQYDQSHGIQNCYYNAANPADGNCPGGGKALEEMATAAFAQSLNTTEEIWLWAEDVNGGLPYLKAVTPPASPAPKTVTVRVVLATYDRETYAFKPFGEPVSVTLESDGNTRVIDVLDAAQAQELLTYAYDTTPTMGRYIHTINGYQVSAPDGWMFTVNDALSNVSASLATVSEGDTILWFEGTTENRFLPPTLAELEGNELAWETINTVDDLLALAGSAQTEAAGLLDAGADALGKNYRLTADLDLAGVDFPGIGSAQRPFTGIFDGQGYTVSNMTRRGTDNVGFVNVLRGGAVQNLKLAGATVEGQSNVGAVVGWAQADVSANVASLVGNCAVQDGSVTGASNVGGIVGLNGADADRDAGLTIASSVDKCAADARVSGSGDKIGGLVGSNEGNVTKSAATGAVDANGAAMVGGLAGDNPGSIYQSHAAGTVSGGNVVGGFVGSSSGNVKDSYALGSVTAQGTAGGFAGTLAAADTVMSAGTVTASGGYVGALAGELNGKLVGAPAQITVKNAFANCAGGLSPIGNTSQFSGEGNAAALEGLKLTEDDAVAEKLHELFQVPLAPTVDPAALMDAIAAKLATSPDPWAAMDMVRYSALEHKTAATTAEARQEALDALITQAASADASVSDRVLVEITARSLGVDSKVLYPAGAENAVNNAQRLADMDLTAGGYYSAPWVLLAAQQGNVQLTQAQTDALIGLLEDSAGDGLFVSEYGPDPDTAGTTLAALAPYDSDSARALREKILTALPAALNDAGSLGNANSDAMVILGLLAVGRDPAEVVNPTTGASLVDGLLSYASETEDGFLYAGEENALATEQGFRALVALAMFDGSAPVSFYDFSAVSVQPGYATGWSEPDKPNPPSPPSGDKTITVQFTLKTDTEVWVPTADLTLPENATVADALSKAASKADITVNGLASGYIKSMTKGGVTLAEFDKGPNSGWLYQVNGAAPTVPFSAYALKDGDDVLWYYAADWTQDPAASRPVSGSGSYRQDEPKDEPKEDEPKDEPEDNKAVWSFGDVSEDAWYYDSVKAVCGRGLMVGMGQGSFAPESATSRAMIATVLWRLAGEPEAGLDRTFADVPDAQWYTKAVNWAAKTGVVTGTGSGFAPNRDITRQELVTMLYRYAKPSPAEARALEPYRDADEVAPWALDAMAWAVDAGVLTGKPGNLLDPQGGATRAQVAAVLDRWLTGKKGPVPVSDPKLDDAISATSAYLLGAVPAPQVGAVGGEWTVLALARSGMATEAYLADYRTAVREYVAEKKGVLDTRKYTEYSRLVLALTALGVDARDVSGYDLTAPLSDYGKVIRQGINGAAWALIALDSGDYPAPGDVRQQYVDLLLARQLPGGGWSLTEAGDAEADVTAMVLQALAGYRDQAVVAQAVDNALAALSAQQNADGSFSSWGTANAESCAQVIAALGELGVRLDDPRFVKDGHTALDGLLTFALPNGGFAHALGETANLMTTEQALNALAAARAD